MKPALCSTLISTLVFTLCASAGQPAGAARIVETVDHEKGRLEWIYKGKKLLTYAFASHQFKPYVQSLFTLEGDDVLRDAPADHLHHHALMYAIRVNGVNFWEERDKPGHERPVRLLSHSTGTTSAGLPQATFTHLIHWVRDEDHALADTAPAALLIERRTLTLVADEARKEIALRWNAKFEAGPAADRVNLHGSDYNGLGLRLPAAWDRMAGHLNSENTAYSKEHRGDVTPARWGAIRHTLDGREITVALFGHPANRGTTSFFSMRDPFAYLAVTQNLSKAPIEYARGDKFGIDYLVVVSSHRASHEQLDGRYARWVKELQ
jgi:hypothetical protein